MLTSKLQRELATNAYVTASTVHHDTLNTYTTASNVQNDVADTRTTVSDIHRNGLKSPKYTRGQEQTVSTTPTSPVTG